jgi:hypothetical protein
MRCLLLLTVACVTLGSSVARGQAWNFDGALSRQGKEILRSETSSLHEFEYAWRDTKVILEFTQYDCQFSITEESIIPDTATGTALTMFFGGICDLEALSGGLTTFRENAFPQEKIEEILVGDRVATMVFKFED